MNGQALDRQPSISPRIVHSLSVLAVQMAIDFDGELRCRAEEIENVHAKWVLAAKDRTVGQASPQPRPKHDFGFGHRPA